MASREVFPIEQRMNIAVANNDMRTVMELFSYVFAVDQCCEAMITAIAYKRIDMVKYFVSRGVRGEDHAWRAYKCEEIRKFLSK